ncbi:MAG TPA: TolC family protein, partial [Methylophaga aminisulfidivorans]|nr:TolC family protein [Methylophaga aminisulfidivorans]
MKRLLLTTLVSLSITGCASFRDYQAPTTDEAVENVQLADARYQFATAQQPIVEWWNAFNDPQLSQLVTEALTHNLDVRIALANLQAARALSRAVGSDRYPT